FYSQDREQSREPSPSCVEQSARQRLGLQTPKIRARRSQLNIGAARSQSAKCKTDRQAPDPHQTFETSARRRPKDRREVSEFCLLLQPPDRERFSPEFARSAISRKRAAALEIEICSPRRLSASFEGPPSPLRARWKGPTPTQLLHLLQD